MPRCSLSGGVCLFGDTLWGREACLAFSSELIPGVRQLRRKQLRKPHGFEITLLGLALLLVASCGDDSTTTPEAISGTLSGTVQNVVTDLPVEGTVVFLVTDEFAIVQAAQSGDEGEFSFPEMPPGSYLIYALDENHLLVDWHQARVRITRGETATVDLSMVPSDQSAPLTYRIEGRVTDVVTGDPVTGAWVMPVGYGEAGNSVRYLTNNSGLVAGVSGPDGRYSLPVWPIRLGYPAGPVVGLGPVSSSAAGYRPRTFVGTVPSSPDVPWLQTGWLPAPADSVLVLDIALEPIPEGGLPVSATGTLSGRVISGGVPQAEVMVMATLTILAEQDTVPDPVKTVVPGGSMWSRADGSFDLQVEPGWYAVRPGLLPDDGWRPGGSPMVEVLAGQTVSLGDMGIVPAVLPIFPRRGAEETYPMRTLTWTSVPGAERYAIEIVSGSDYYYTATTPDTFYAIPTTFSLEPSASVYRWEVRAQLRIESPFYTNINQFEVPATFRVIEGRP